MLDFRTEKDKKDGIGYEIYCDTCGQVSLSSHASYCPYCTRDTVANFTAVRIGKKAKENENREDIPLRTFMVPVAFECYGRVPVTGRFKNAKDVLQYADEHSDEFNLPSTAEYLDESFEVDMDGIVWDEYGNEIE